MNVHSYRNSASRMSVEEFFDWSAEQSDRYELVEGTPRMLPWVKLNHNRIVTNLVGALFSRLDGAQYEISTGDFAVQVGENSIRHADLMVFPAGKPGYIRTIVDATLVVEVLSTSTAHVDFGPKLNEYQALVALDTYLIIDQDNMKIWVWSRDSEGSWPNAPTVIKNSDAILKLERLAMDLPLSEIYRNVN